MPVLERVRHQSGVEQFPILYEAARKTDEFDQLDSDTKIHIFSIGRACINLVEEMSEDHELNFIGALKRAELDGVDEEIMAEYAANIVSVLASE